MVIDIIKSYYVQVLCKFVAIPIQYFFPHSVDKQPTVLITSGLKMFSIGPFLNCTTNQNQKKVVKKMHMGMPMSHTHQISRELEKPSNY